MGRRGCRGGAGDERVDGSAEGRAADGVGAARPLRAAMHERFGGPAAWLLALPVTGIGGLQVLVRSLVGQCEPIVLRSVGGAASFDPAEFADATWRLDPSLPAWTSLVPAQAARLLDDPAGLAAMRAYEMVLLGGARTPPALLERLRDESIAAVTSYGMTETCGGAYYEGTALPGVAATILEPDADGVGRIAIGGPTVARGYLGDAAATARRVLRRPRGHCRPRPALRRRRARGARPRRRRGAGRRRQRGGVGGRGRAAHGVRRRVRARDAGRGVGLAADGVRRRRTGRRARSWPP